MLGSVLSLGAALFWASSVILFKKCGEEISPIPLNIYKCFVAFILLSLSMFILGIKFVPDNQPSDWLLLCFSGVVGIALADICFFIALEKLGAGLVAIVECLYLPSVIFLSFVFLGERLSNGAIVGALLILSAVLVSSLPKRGVRKLDSQRKIPLAGLLFGCLSILLIAVSIVSVKEILERSDVFWATFVRVVAGSASLILIIGFHPNRKQHLKELRFSKVWLYALPASISANYLALLCWIGGMKYSASASQAAILNQLSTVITFILAALFLKERITLNKAVAIILAFSGVYLTLFY
ncbi:MAG: EamA family transporter [Desulfobulbaceae bacterium]|nr:MAG: EamA family transporter [Desulfobulbaceae bacterium]